VAYSWTYPPTFVTGDYTQSSAAMLTALAENLGYLWEQTQRRAVELWHRNSIPTAGSDIAIVQETAQQYGHYAHQSPGAQNDAFEQTFILAAGTYNFYTLGRTFDNAGTASWALDGTTIESAQDWYTAGSTTNVIKVVGSVVVAETERHILTCTVSVKNALSTGYYLRLTYFWFEPSSDA